MEIVDASASITLPTTDSIFIPPSVTTVFANEISYDSATGIIYITHASTYSFSITFNVTPPSSNKTMYFYAEAMPLGGSWTPIEYSGKQLELPNAAETQVLVTASKYYGDSSKLRFHVWGNAANIHLVTSNLDGLTTVKKPAFRMQMA